MLNRQALKAQSTLEYIIVLSVIVTAILFGAVALIKPAVNQTVTSTGDALVQAANQFNANPAAP